MANLSTLLGGGPSGKDVARNAGKLIGPDGNNYVIHGTPQYQTAVNNETTNAHNTANNGFGTYNAGLADNGMSQQASATGLLAQTAMGNGPSLARANMQAGLAQQAAALQSQAMSNQGNTGQGESQRNLLNAQAAAGNNTVQAGGIASAAEQLGAQGQYVGAANAQTNSAMNNALNASNAGFQHNAQQFQAAQIGAQNALAAHNADVQQQGASQAYDNSMQDLGRARAGIGLQATQASAANTGFLGKKILDTGASLAQMAAF